MTHISLKVNFAWSGFLERKHIWNVGSFYVFSLKILHKLLWFSSRNKPNQNKKNERWFCFLFASLYINTLWTVVRISRLLSILLLIFWEDMIYKSSNKSSTNLEVIFSVERLKRGKWQKYWRKDKALLPVLLDCALIFICLPVAPCTSAKMYAWTYICTQIYGN